MRIIIVGSRSIYDPSVVGDAISASGWQPTAVITGGNNAVDRFAERWARAHDLPVDVLDVQAVGAEHESSVALRNRAMLESADALIAIWDGVSPGTARLIDEARRIKKPLYVHDV